MKQNNHIAVNKAKSTASPSVRPTVILSTIGILPLTIILSLLLVLSLIVG